MDDRLRQAKSKSFRYRPLIWLLLSLFAITAPFSPPAGRAAGREFVSSAAGSADFYVAPTGTPAGDGTLTNPWDLATALSHPSQVQPGDTIWLRGGTYRGIFTSYLTGTAGQPIVVRSYPNEWAVIDTRAQAGDGDAFIVRGSWAYYWGFELMNSRTTNRGENGFGFLGNSQNNKFINLIIHDVGNNTFRDGNEIYGSIFYNNGSDGVSTRHHLYTQNDDPSQPDRVVDSIFFNSFGFGLHVYAGGGGQLRGIHLIGNVWFKNGAAQTIGDRKDDVLVGGVNGAESILLRENMGWAPSPTERSVKLGRYSDLNIDISLVDNYLAGDTTFYNTWQSVTMTGNTFYAMSPGNGTNFDPTQFPNNTYLTNRPSGTKVFIRPNQYEAGRAHIIVYNWDLADTVAVDVSGILSPGSVYEVRNAQNYLAAPVTAGIYEGGTLTLPMTGLKPAQPIGSGKIDPAEFSGKEFNVFVLLQVGRCQSCTRQVHLPLIAK